MIRSVCIFGDSVARGVVLDEAKQRYVDSRSCFARLVAEASHIAVENFARFGCTVTKGSRVAQRHLEDAARADYTVVEFGGNDCDYRWQQVAADPLSPHDCNTPPARFCAEYGALLQQVRRAGGRPVAFSLPPVEEERYFDWISRGLSKDALLQFLGGVRRIYDWQAHYSDLAVQTAQALGAPVVDLRGAFLSQRDYRDLLCRDGIHPNEAGHRLITQVLEDRIEALA